MNSRIRGQQLSDLVCPYRSVPPSTIMVARHIPRVEQTRSAKIIRRAMVVISTPGRDDGTENHNMRQLHRIITMGNEQERRRFSYFSPCALQNLLCECLGLSLSRFFILHSAPCTALRFQCFLHSPCCSSKIAFSALVLSPA